MPQIHKNQDQAGSVSKDSREKSGRLRCLSFFVLFASYFANAQTYITYESIKILGDAYSYTIKYGSYVAPPMYHGTQTDVYAAAQERYDIAFEFIRSELQRVIHLPLINQATRSYKEKYVADRTSMWRTFGQYDLTKPQIMSWCSKSIFQIYDYEPILSELKLLQSCNGELQRIKMQDANNYIYSKRYKALSTVLQKLETCPPEEIKTLSWEKTELEMKN